MKVRLTPAAVDDLRAIRSWIGERNEPAGDRVVARLLQSAMFLEQFPKLGRNGKVSGTREFSVPGLPYVIVYGEPVEEEVDVLTFLHERRNYPPG